MRDGMQVTHRGKIGPATLSKPEVQGASEISAQEEYESGAGRKVPRPSEQTRMAALRGLGLKAQAKDRSLRDKVVRGGGVKKKRQIDPSYKILSTRSVPQWGESNVSLVGDSSESLNKTGGKTTGKIGDWFKGLLAPPAVKTPAVKGPAGSAVKGGVESWKAHGKKMKTLRATPSKGPKAPKLSEKPITQKKYQSILQQQKAVESDPLGVAEQQGVKVSPWAKMVSNPYGSMLMQMAAMSAIEPIMYGMGIRSPILGGILPFMAMQSLPGILESSAGIPRLQNVMMRRAQRGRINLPGQQPAVAQPAQAPATGMVNTASVAIPEITTVFA